MIVFGTMLVIETRTNDKYFKTKSASWPCQLNSLAFLMAHPTVVLRHTNTDTNEVRDTIVNGYHIYNRGVQRTKSGDVYVTFGY